MNVIGFLVFAVAAILGCAVIGVSMDSAFGLAGTRVGQAYFTFGFIFGAIVTIVCWIFMGK